MKKIALLTALLGLTACNTYHNGRAGLVLADTVDVNTVANVKVDAGNKISGVAECSSVLYVFHSEPERQSHIPTLQTASGNIASSACTNGAIYDALDGVNADVIVAPQYTTVQNGLLCFGSRCLFGTTKVLVSGYAGKITSFVNK